VFHKRVSQKTSRSIINSAPALLVLVPHRIGHETWVPSKLYSYLFSSAPILALVPEGDAGRIVESTGRGVVIRETDPARVARLIMGFLSAARAGRVLGNPVEEEIRNYRMDVVMSRMDCVLKSCVRHTAN
jgi:hypothetical protein